MATVEQLATLLEMAAAPTGTPQQVTTWLGQQLECRASLLSRGAGDAVDAGAVVALREGRTRTPFVGLTGFGEHILLVAAGRQSPPQSRPLLQAVRARPWTEEDTDVVVAAGAALSVITRMGEVAAREIAISAAAAAARVAALQALMVGDLVKAGRAAEPLAPGLIAAGAGLVAVLECPRGDERALVGEQVDRVLEGQALTVLCPVDDQQVILLYPASAPKALTTLLTPIIDAVRGRAVGVSQATPWGKVAAAYEAAAAALASTRDGNSGPIAVHDSRLSLADRLGTDARIWAELVLQPLEELSLRERQELLQVGQEALHWGESAGSRLIGWSRYTLARRLNRLSELSGLDRFDSDQRAALYLATRLVAAPAPAVIHRHVTLPHALAHDGARAWATEVLSPLGNTTRRALVAWARDGAEAAATLGIARTTLYRRLQRAVAATHLEFTTYPGPATEILLALHIAGDVEMGRLPDLSSRQLSDTRGGHVHDHTEIDTTQAHPARIYDYLLGGRMNFAADRATAAAILEQSPHTPIAAQANRRFMLRVTRTLVDHGARQFIDLGSGIPTQPNLHEIAQTIAPDTRVAYVDSDPIVTSHAASVLRDSDQTRTTYLLADIRDGADLLDHPQIRAVIDLNKPVALSAYALLHFIPGEDAYDILKSFTARLAPGSWLVLSHITADYEPDLMGKTVAHYSRNVTAAQTRTQAQVSRFFDGMHLYNPGVVSLPQWHPESDGTPVPSDHDVNGYGGLARLP